MRRVMLQAANGNTGVIYIGDSTVVAAKCWELSKGSAIVLNVDDFTDNQADAFIDLADLYADAATSGDKVNIIELQIVSVDLRD